VAYTLRIKHLSIFFVLALLICSCQSPPAPKAVASECSASSYSSHQELIAIPQTSQLLVADGAANRILLVSVSARSVSNIPLAGHSDGVSATSDGSTAFVATNSGNAASITILNLPKGTIRSTFPLQHRAVGGLVSKADGSSLFAIASSPELTLLKLDPLTSTLISQRAIEGSNRISPLRKPIFLSADERTVFVLDTWRADGQSTLLAFDATTLQLVREFTLGRNIRDVAMSNDKRVLAFSRNIRDNEAPGHFRGEVRLLDLSSGLVVRTLELGAGTLGLAFAPASNSLWAAHDEIKPGALSNITLDSGKTVQIETDGIFPTFAAKSAIGSTLYFSGAEKADGGKSGWIIGVDTSKKKIGERILLPNLPRASGTASDC
jgi:DNA-binding beta-propeller fold protein YncE